MAKFQRPPEIQIPVLEEKKRVVIYNLMEPGPGTPWENRGTHGLPLAFLLTCWAGIKSPLKLVHAIRRPETSGEVTEFAFGCGLLWSAARIIQAFAVNAGWIGTGPGSETGRFWFGVFVQAIIIPFALVLALKFCAGMFYKLVSFEMKSKAPPVLVVNVFGYALAPSLISIIPVIGPPLAGFWIVMLWFIIGIKRLRISVGGTIIALLLTLITAAALTAGCIVGGWFLWEYLTAT